MEYVPRMSEDNNLILDRTLEYEECLNYAKQNKLNVIYRETTSTLSVEVIMKFQNAGYVSEIYEVPIVAPDGTMLGPKVYCKFLWRRNNNENDDKTELLKLAGIMAIAARSVVESDVKSLSNKKAYWKTH